MRRASIVIMVMAALGLSLAVPAFAQDGYPIGPGVSCDVTSVQAGGTVGVDGSNWLPESTVVLTFQSDPVVVGTPETDSEGAFSTTVTIPSDAEAGSHTITATGRNQEGDPDSATCALTVTAGEEPGGVAFTGTNISLGLVILAVLVAAGLGFMVAGRRKKADANH
jgi:hypothetical protein